MAQDAMRGNRNQNSRAVVSALQCDYIYLRLAARDIVDDVTRRDESHPTRAVMLEFDCARNTALRLRELAENVRKEKS